MKKLLIPFSLITILFACSNPAAKETATSETADYPANADGYNLGTTANTETILKTIKAMEAMDTVAYRSYYAPGAIFHDNLDSMTLDQNIQFIASFKANGISVNITDTKPMWEIVNKKASPDGVRNYVISYQLGEFTKGDKTVKVIMNAVDAFKDGKIVEEWNTYDTRKVSELFK